MKILIGFERIAEVRASKIKDEARNALQNAFTYLQTMDAFSEMTEEQIDIHHHIGYVMEVEEDKILKYILGLAKNKQIK